MEQSLSDEDGEPPLENEDPADDAPQELPDSELLTEVKRLERDTSFLALRISELKLEATSPTNQAIIRARATKEFNERLGQLEDQKYSIAVVFPLEKHTQRMNDLDLRNLDLPENLFELGRKDMRAEFRAFFRLEAFRDLQRTEENLADLLHELLDRAHPALEQLEHNIWQRRRTLRTAAESHLQELHYFKQMDTLEQKKKRQKSQRVHEEMKSLLLILEEPQGVYSLYDAELGHKMRMKTWLLWDLLAADIEVTSKLLHGLRSNVFTRLRHTFSSSLHGHQHRALRIQSCLSDMSDVCKEMDREIFNLFRAHKRDNTHLSRYMTNAVLRANRPATMVAQSTGEMYQTFLDLHLDGLRWPQTAAQHHIASTLGPVWLYLRQQRILQDAVEELVSFTTKAASRLQPRTDDPNDCSEPEHLHLNLDGFLEAYSNWLADRRDLLYCHNECSTWFGIFKLLQPNLVRDTSYGQKVGPLVRRQVEVLEYKPIVEAVNGLYREKLSWPIDDYLYPQQQAIPVYYICSPKYLHSALKTLKGAKVLGLDTVIRQQTVYSTYKTSQATALMLASEDCILIISSTILRENGYSLYEHGLLDLRDLLSDPQILKVGPNMTWTREALYHSFAIDMQGCVELGAHSASGALSMLDEDRNWPYLETLARQHDSIRLYGRPGVGAGFFCVVRHLATRAYAALKIYRDRYGFESPPKSTLATDARSAPAFGPLHLDDASVITGPDYFQLEVRGALQRLSSSGGSGKKIAGAKFRTDVLLAETYRMARHALARIKSRNDNGPGTQIALEHLQAYHLATTFTENDPRVVGELLGLRSPARTILQVAEVARLPLNDYHRAMFVAVKESEPPLAQEGRPTVTLRRRPWSTRSKTAPAGSLPAVSDDPNEHDALTDTATESPMDHAPPHDVQGPPQGRVRKYVFSERVIRRLKASRPSERRCERQWRIK
ncbi:uncharacterized protein HMPREF1541_04860 [Cyphellophora europaea CBS 101466]|uniref:Uncharacterized protein n=1 Tax=Cyphellophora europaea (strain CBS 101466) TaxID=1220924 RepID=W2RXT2_CYPE1|nr:uncharacterized protein HMPREF1541_04860 [Cyphellophora europaea CBS 101466]ETN40583.1 hypothetical protein HMPREF1541_04860 [Cyphellophora europaea CBS 101466]